MRHESKDIKIQRRETKNKTRTYFTGSQLAKINFKANSQRQKENGV